MKHLRVAICSFCLILGLSTISSAQDDRQPPLVPGKEFRLEPEPFDKYDGITWAYEKARLDTFAIGLLQDPQWVGYIIVYAGRGSCADSAQRRGMRAKKYLVERRGLDWNRVIWQDAGYLEEPYVMLWMYVRGEMPNSVDLPEPLKDIKIRKCRAKAVRQQRRGRK